MGKKVHIIVEKQEIVPTADGGIVRTHDLIEIEHDDLHEMLLDRHGHYVRFRVIGAAPLTGWGKPTEDTP